MCVEPLSAAVRPAPVLLNFRGWVVSVSVGASGALFSSVSVPDLPKHDELNCL